MPRCPPRGVARLSFFSSLLHSKREKRRADRWRSARTSAPHRHARRQNDLQLDAQRPCHLRKPHVTPRFSSTRAPMPLQNVGGFRASPENLPERQWAFSHRSFRRKKSMYLVHIHGQKTRKVRDPQIWLLGLLWYGGPQGRVTIILRAKQAPALQVAKRCRGRAGGNQSNGGGAGIVSSWSSVIKPLAVTLCMRGRGRCDTHRRHRTLSSQRRSGCSYGKGAVCSADLRWRTSN